MTDTNLLPFIQATKMGMLDGCVGGIDNKYSGDSNRDQSHNELGYAVAAHLAC